jgi:hypothetical protein
MTELELYKFIHHNDIEYRREDNEGTSDILMFLYVFQLEDFCKLVKDYNIDDGGLSIRLVNCYVAIWMNEVCDYYDIDIDKVFVGKK